MRYGKHFVAVTALVAVLFVIVYVLLRAIYQLPLAASDEALAIDTLFEAHFFLIAFLFALVVGFMLYSLVVFRQRPGDEEDGDHFHGHTGLEIAWTIVPLGLVIFFGVWGAQMLGDITERPDDAMVVRVFGQQWSWAFEYPDLDDMRTSELVLPVNQTVILEMEALDVLHSFWVPEFRVKQDLVPGQVDVLRITPTETGEYTVRCAEMCGTQHAYMLAPVQVLTQSEFEAWTAEQSGSVLELSPEERGEVWYEQFGCNSCHSLDGSVVVGPSWQNLYGSERPLQSGETVVADEEYLRRSILEPNVELVEGFAAAMPTNFEEQFAQVEEQHGGEVDIVAELIAFIEALSEQEAVGE
ncbi:MAG TPA: cytochrome c oxidase subunit II [Candidatus Sulfomarinibacteraceae bacterium]|nr:cytochrome c oxidase subunit II [Candidatus Sulfomarinibacteraceae bacterium]